MTILKLNCNRLLIKSLNNNLNLPNIVYLQLIISGSSINLLLCDRKLEIRQAVPFCSVLMIVV